MLIVLALFGPVYASESAGVRISGRDHGSSERTIVRSTSHSSLVEHEGAWTLLPVSVPALITVAVWSATRRFHARAGRIAGPLAWSAITLLTLFSLVSAASIGLFLLPVAALLALALAVAPASRVARTGHAS